MRDQSKKDLLCHLTRRRLYLFISVLFFIGRKRQATHRTGTIMANNSLGGRSRSSPPSSEQRGGGGGVIGEDAMNGDGRRKQVSFAVAAAANSSGAADEVAAMNASTGSESWRNFVDYLHDEKAGGNFTTQREETDTATATAGAPAPPLQFQAKPTRGAPNFSHYNIEDRTSIMNSEREVDRHRHRRAQRRRSSTSYESLSRLKRSLSDGDFPTDIDSDSDDSDDDDARINRTVKSMLPRAASSESSDLSLRRHGLASSTHQKFNSYLKSKR